MKNVSILVDTRINGNKIIGNKYYETLLRNTTKKTILEYAAAMEINNIYGNKIQMIEKIVNHYKG